MKFTIFFKYFNTKKTFKEKQKSRTEEGDTDRRRYM